MPCTNRLLKHCKLYFTSKLKQNMGLKSSVAVHLALLFSYYYLLTYRRDVAIDDAVIGFAQYCDVIVVVQLLWALHTDNMNYYIYKVFRNVIVYGRCRVFLYTLSLALVAYCLVFAVDRITVFTQNAAGEEVLKRLEDSIVYVQEDRTSPEELVRHPATRGLSEPAHLHKLFRYPMEDIQIKCSSFEVLWFSGKPLSRDHVTWRLNGIPLEHTDRHKHQVDMEELPFISHRYRQDLKELGVSMFEVRATLTIHLLQESDFGSYTCHVQNVKKGVLQYIYFMKSIAIYTTNMDKSKHGRKQTEKTRTNVSENQPKRNASENRKQTKHKTRQNKNENPPPKENPRPSFCQCEQVPMPYYMPQDTVTWTEEYRVIRMPSKQDKLRVPPASILRFSTTYLMFSRNDEIEVEYVVDDNDFFNLCPGVFSGCSAILLYYWMTGHELGEYHGQPPFFLSFTWDWESLSKLFQHVHCLCENSYGIHSVRYLRRYFNQTIGQYELVEILHPHQLAIIPRDQTMMYYKFINSSMSSFDIPGAETTPEYLSYFKPIIENLQVRKELALALMNCFRLTELIYLVVVLVLGSIILSYTGKFLRWLGGLIRRCTLQGSLAHYIIAVFHKYHPPAESGPSYNVFMSYCDAERDTTIARDVVSPFLEEQGHKVCLPDRDLPPNALEIQALTEAVVHSKRFIVFLSEDYIKDKFHQDLEASIIAESLLDRPNEPNQVLVVRLDSCEVPLSLRHHPLYNWTNNLTNEDHLLRLLRWLEPDKYAHNLRSPTDVFITLLPFEVTFASIVAAYWFL